MFWLPPREQVEQPETNERNLQARHLGERRAMAKQHRANQLITTRMSVGKISLIIPGTSSLIRAAAGG